VVPRDSYVEAAVALVEAGALDRAGLLAVIHSAAHGLAGVDFERPRQQKARASEHAAAVAAAAVVLGPISPDDLYLPTSR
jgi:hypothetical protein